jgi:hypothetical protein
MANLIPEGLNVHFMPTFASLAASVKTGNGAHPVTTRENNSVLPPKLVAAPAPTPEKAAEPTADANFDPLAETRDFLWPSPTRPGEEARLPTAWGAHIPLMRCIIRYQRPRRFVELGSQYGASFFSACRAVRECHTSTECIAVDSWQGDAHTGGYYEDVYQAFKAGLEHSYADFASLVRSTFAEAVGKFENGSIDLLHIDGYHTYDAVKEDFETWLPKMSDAGVVLLHDTCVRRDTFGVFRMVDELAQRYPLFNVAHDNGLGMVAVGNSSTRMLKLIKAWSANPGLGALVVEFLNCIGSWSSAYAELETRSAALEAQCADLQRRHAESELHAKSLEAAIAERSRTLAAFLESKSWRITAPMRAMARFLSRSRSGGTPRTK